MTSEEAPRSLADVVKAAAMDAKDNQVERARLEAVVRNPKGATAVHRNAVRLDLILRRTLPPNAAGALQRVLDRALDTLYGDFGLDAQRVGMLLEERRDVHRFAVTPLAPRIADALAYLSDVVAACEEAPDKVSGQALADAGLDTDSLISGRTAARGRKKGSREAADQRRHSATAVHDEWVKVAERRIAGGTAPHNVASAIAPQFKVTSKAMRTVLQRRGVIKKRKSP